MGLSALLLLSSLFPVQAQSSPRVDAAVQVTNEPSEIRGHAIPAVAVHPDDDQVIAISEGNPYSGRCAVHVSSDAGLTWSVADAPVLPEEYPSCIYSNYGGLTDVAFASDGTLYYALSGFNPRTYHQRVFLARSTNLGRSWQTSQLPWVKPDLSKGEIGADALPSLAVDPNDPERVAVGWMSNNGTWNMSKKVLGGNEYFYDVRSRPYIAISDDGGRTFAGPFDAAGEMEGWFAEPHLVAGNDGELFVFFGENTKSAKDAREDAKAPPARLHVAVSRDGGESFSQKALWTQTDPADSDWLGVPAPGIDRRTGDLYVAWEDMGKGKPRLLFIRSDDSGRTWSRPVKLNDVDPKLDWDFNQFLASLDVAPNGRIDVAWHDWRNDAGFDPKEEANRFQDIYYSYSTDGGRTWSPDLKVNDRAIDRSIGLWDTGDIEGPLGVASTEDAAYIAWDDTRNGNERTMTQDIYFTRVRFADPETIFTGAERSGLLWGLLGAGVALAVGGLLLLIGTRVARRREPEPEAQPAAAPRRR